MTHPALKEAFETIGRRAEVDAFIKERDAERERQRQQAEEDREQREAAIRAERAAWLSRYGPRRKSPEPAKGKDDDLKRLLEESEKRRIAETLRRRREDFGSKPSSPTRKEPTEQWNRIVAAKQADGLTREQAFMQAAREHPALRAELIASANNFG